MNRNYLIICLCCVLALNGLGIQELKKQRIELKPETEELIKRENEKKVIQRNSKEKMEETSESKSESEEKKNKGRKIRNKRSKSGVRNFGCNYDRTVYILFFMNG